MPYRLKITQHHAQIMNIPTQRGITFPVGPGMSLFIHELVGKANAFDALATVAGLPSDGDYSKAMQEFVEYKRQRTEGLTHEA